MSSQTQVELCYWPIKYRCEYIRWLLAYLKVDFKETFPRDANEWALMKTKLSPLNPLVNLPFLRDSASEKVISETDAIAFAIALRYGGKELLGKDGAEIIMHRSIQEQLKTIREFALKCFEYNRADLIKLFDIVCEERVVPKLRYMDNLKRLDYRFLIGAPTVADFELTHIIQILDYVAANTGLRNPIVDFPNLYQIADNVKALQGVGQYIRANEQRPWHFQQMTKFLN